MPGPAVELAKFRAEVHTYVAHALLRPFQMARAEHLMPMPGSENQHENGSFACVSIRYPAQ
jgi:hypothetical protein